MSRYHQCRCLDCYSQYHFHMVIALKEKNIFYQLIHTLSRIFCKLDFWMSLTLPKGGYQILAKHLDHKKVSAKKLYKFQTTYPPPLVHIVIEHPLITYILKDGLNMLPEQSTWLLQSLSQSHCSLLQSPCPLHWALSLQMKSAKIRSLFNIIAQYM